MKRKAKPVESHIFAGMEAAVQAQAESAAQVAGEELTKAMLEPLGNISAKAGAMEMDSPLFYGRIHKSLFDD